MMEFNLIQKIAIWALPVLFAITVHEVAHGWVASKFGDQTARFAGRLTLNPLNHVDLVGTIIVPIVMLMVSNFIFGWAKPVPVDMRNLKHRYQMVLVACAGPASNFLMAILWALIAKLGLHLNPWLGIPLTYMGQAGILINIVLGVLNCLPLPPLDGGHALMYLLRGRWAYYFSRLEPYGFFILILLMLSGALSFIIAPLIFSLVKGLMIMVAL